MPAKRHPLDTQHGHVIGRIETKAVARYLSLLVGETMGHNAPALRFSPYTITFLLIPSVCLSSRPQLSRSIRYSYFLLATSIEQARSMDTADSTVHTHDHGTTLQGRGDDRKSDIRFPLDLPATLRRRSETAPRGITESHTDI